MNYKGALIVGILLEILLAGAAAAFYFLYYVHTPAYSMNSLQKAVVSHNTEEFQKYVDLDAVLNKGANDLSKLIEFRLEANVNTYAAYMNETDSTRIDSHDFSYSSGPYIYHDTYVGGEKFAGEEAIWVDGKIQYAMNYLGRVLDQQFNGD